MKVAKRIGRKLLLRSQEAWDARRQSKFSSELCFTDVVKKYTDRNELHAYMHHYFKHYCPPEIRSHRMYYKEGARGFGENAFHAMWYLLLREYKPKLCLEIGVYRGQVISLWALIARMLDIKCEIHGISPFAPLGDEVSNYLAEVDYYADTISHHRKFHLEPPILLRSLSTDVEAIEHIRARQWDLIYIDGSHDYEFALSDYENCRDNLAIGGLLVMDDSSLYSGYKPPLYSFAGHPGPSKIVEQFAMKELIFIAGVGHNNIFLKA